jgi:hypothetical protein
MAQSDTTSTTSLRPAQPARLHSLDWICLVLMVIGAINWGLVAAIDLDLVATLLGTGSAASRIVYMLVGLAGLYGVILMARLGRDAAR